MPELANLKIKYSTFPLHIFSDTANISFRALLSPDKMQITTFPSKSI